MNKINKHSYLKLKKENARLKQEIKKLQTRNLKNQNLRKAIKKAEESEIRYKALHDASFGGIAIHENGIILDCNKCLEEITGYSYDELIGMNGFHLFAESQRKIVLERVARGYNKPYESVGVKKNGQIFPARLNARNIKYRGRVVRIVEVRDISEQKKIEKELILAKEKAEESDRLKTEFLNNISHEIRTPLNGILGFSEFLSEKDLSKEKFNNYIQIIQNSGRQLLYIFEEILEISQLETQNILIQEEEICLNDLLFNLYTIFDVRKKEGVPLYFQKKYSDINSTIICDRSHLTKILTNLLENSFKYTLNGYIELGYDIVNDYLLIYVKDTGIGIKPENQKIIFDRFSQEEKEPSKKTGGLGLGLTIAQKYCKLLGGNITVQSKKNFGTTFYIKLPYKPAHSKIVQKNQIKEKNIKNHTILIVEDEEVNHLYLSTLFEKQVDLDIQTLHAKNGKEAVAICIENESIDLIIMDLKMPIMNGFEATELIRDIYPDTPIIAQTSYTSKKDHDKATECGCNDIITKPINTKEALQIVKKYL